MVTPKATPKAESMERRANSTGTPGQTVSSLLGKHNQNVWETESDTNPKRNNLTIQAEQEHTVWASRVVKTGEKLSAAFLLRVLGLEIIC